MAKPGRTGLGAGDVAQAVAALRAEGISTTIRAVRDRLGRGSLGTIQRHLATLNSGESGVSADRAALPALVGDVILQWVEEEVARGTASVRETLEASRATVDALAADNDAVTEQLEEGQDRELTLQRELDVAQERISSLEAAASEARTQYREAVLAERTVGDRLARAEAKLERLNELQDETRALRASLSDREVEGAKAGAALMEADAQMKLVAERLQHQLVRADECREDLFGMKAELQAERQRRQVAEAEVVRVTRLLEQLIALAPEKSVPGARKRAPATG